MMVQINKMSVYWGKREESATECARRLSDYLSQLSAQHPQLGSWYQRGSTRKSASRGASINSYTFEDLVAFVSKGAHKKDIGREVMKELGYHFGGWNKLPNESAMGLSITCGLFANTSTNVVIMNLPMNWDSVGLTDARLKNLLVLTAEIWDADWGGAFNSHNEAWLSRPNNDPYLDKMLWLRHGNPFTVKGNDLTQETTDKGTVFVRR